MNRLEVRHLSTSFDTDDGRVHAVADVSFAIRAGRTTAIVGESGSGKSVTSLTLMRLLPRTAATQVSGEALFVDRAGATLDLLSLPEPRMRALRGNEVAMIFQEPMTSLNPVFSVGEQIAESLRLHKHLDRAAARAEALRMLELVEIPAAAQRLDEYPHQLSGGMRQRVMIALAMACDPTLLIADEPTTALDVTIQAQILALMRRLQTETGMSILFITHNLGVVAHHADDVAVMYAGRIVEAAPVRPLFAAPRHPYTQGLLACLPGKAHAAGLPRPKRLFAIRGQVSSPLAPPPGCAFEPRCDQAEARCAQAMPPLVDDRRRAAGALHPRAGRRPGSEGSLSMDTTLAASADPPLIEVRGLKQLLRRQGQRPVRAVDGVSFAIRRGETLGLVGESGSGKSTIGRTVLRLLDCTAGQVLYRGEDIGKLSSERMRKLRSKLQIIFQDPYASLNPKMRISAILGEALQHAWPGQGHGRRASSASPSCSTPSACDPNTPAASRTSSPAGSASASAWRARWRSSPSSSSPTSRCRRSTCRSSRRSSTCWPTCASACR